MNENLVEMGFCVKPHGIKGAFTFNLFNLEDSVLTNGSKIMIFPKSKESSVDSDGEMVTIKEIAFGNKVIVYLEGISDRNIVEKMIPFIIKVPRDSFPEVKNDEYYINDLVGLKVFNDRDGSEIGVIEDSYDNGAQVVFVVKMTRGKLIDIPFTKNFFPLVDTENGLVRVILPSFV